MRGGGFATLALGTLAICAACGAITGVGDLEVDPDAGDAPPGSASSGSSGSTSSSGESSSSSSASSSSSSSSSSSGAPGDASADASDARADARVDAGTDTGADAGTPSTLLGCQAEGLVAYWKMNENTGTAVRDCSANDLDGTVTTGVSWHAGRNTASALEFSGNATNLVQLPAAQAALKLRGAFTVSTWLYLIDSKGSIIGRATSIDTNSWALWYTSAGVIAGMKDSAGTTNLAITSTFPKTTWRHIAMVFRPGSGLEIWVGNQMTASTTTGVPAMTPDYGDVRIGQVLDPTDTFGHLNGRLQQMRVFSRALTPAEIAQLAAEP